MNRLVKKYYLFVWQVFLGMMGGGILLSSGCSLFQKHSHELGTHFVNSSETLSKPYVVLVSIDGYRSDYTDLYQPTHLSAFRDASAAAEGLIPVFPSSTFTNHTSIITGMYAESHGIIANSFFDAKRQEAYSRSKTASDGSWYQGTPLWVTAQKQGMLSATFFWPASGAEIEGVRPAYYYNYDGSVSNEQRVKQVIDWLKLPEIERPHFITLYFSDVDTTGHQYAPGAPEVRQAIQKVDQSIGILVSELNKLPLPIYTVILSDHGMLGVDFSKILFLEDYVNLEGVQVFCDGPFALLYSKDQARLAHIQTTLREKKLPIDVYLNHEIPPPPEHRAQGMRQACPRCGDLQIRAHAPYNVSLLSLKGDFVPKGVHGYDPATTPSMHGIFYAQGPGLKKGKIPAFENIHVNPFLRHLLKLSADTGAPKPQKPIDGRLEVLRPLLTP